jgi:hypothetical protein
VGISEINILLNAFASGGSTPIRSNTISSSLFEITSIDVLSVNDAKENGEVNSKLSV